MSMSRANGISPARRMVIFGEFRRPKTKRDLLIRYRTDIAYHFQTEREALNAGRSIIDSRFDTVLFTNSVSKKFREFVMGQLETRLNSDELMVGVLTDEPSYANWIQIQPDADAETIAQHFGFDEQGEPAQIVVVVNTKGGVGKTFAAVNLATVLGQMGKKVVLLEDDWMTRSVRDLVGIEVTEKMSTNLVAEIRANQGIVTAELLEKYLVETNGIRALVGPPNILTQFDIDQEMAREIIAVMGHELGIDIIVIDAPPDFLRTSSFTLSLLNEAENAPTPPLIIVPVVPEMAILRSANDTLTLLQYLNHPTSLIWPVVNCLKGEHDPEMLRDKILWQKPAAIIPYCPDAQFDGQRRAPLVTAKDDGVITRMWKEKILGVATPTTVRSAFGVLGKAILDHIEKRKDGTQVTTAPG